MSVKLPEPTDTVVVAFPDLQGRLVGKRMTARHFEEVVDAGTPIGMCRYLLATDWELSVLDGFAFASWSDGYGDMMARPDLTTLRPSWRPGTAIVLCDLFERDGAVVETAPRRILARQIERAAAAGIDLRAGTELEFFLFDASFESVRDSGFRGLRPARPYNEDYQLLDTTGDTDVLDAIRRAAERAGIPVELAKGEAAAGQFEINLEYTTPLAMADRHVLYKLAAKETAAACNRALTFMAKWSSETTGSSCHIHTSIQDDELFGAYLGGIVSAAPELTYFFAHTVNAYKRYRPGSWAPTRVTWGVDNRTCAFRVIPMAKGRRVECRLPGADANPYLALAALLAAGAAGVEERRDPGPPYDGDAYGASCAPAIPSTLHEAADALEASTLARHAFSDAVVDHLVRLARHECAAADAAVTDWELHRYFERG